MGGTSELPRSPAVACAVAMGQIFDLSRSSEILKDIPRLQTYGDFFFIVAPVQAGVQGRGCAPAPDTRFRYAFAGMASRRISADAEHDP